MKGLIFINPYLVPTQSVHQAQRLKEEFNKRKVDIDIISNGFTAVAIDGENTYIDLKNIDFAVYLDKDKYLSQLLERANLRLFNSHNAVRVCDDKGQTYIELSKKGVKFPKTIFGGLCYNKDLKIDLEWAKTIAKKLSYPIIVKESFGSQGKGVKRADNFDELISIMEEVKCKPHLFQEYLGTKQGVDLRVIVIGGKAVASMQRKNENDFRSNIGQGGKGTNKKLTAKEKELAEKCANILGLDYCGVDIIYGENDTPYICEVNSNAFFDEIEKISGVNIAGEYADYIINCINK